MYLSILPRILAAFATAKKRLCSTELRALNIVLDSRNAEIESLRSDLVETQAAMAWLAEENAKLKKQAHTDPLTNILNRRGLEAAYVRHAENAGQSSYRDGLVDAVLLLDLDRFKPINDTYGHDAGDACLKNVASILTRITRERPDAADLVARVGGDEFIVVLMGTRHNAVEETARRIREGINDCALDVDGARTCVSLGVSVGITTCVPAVTVPESLARFKAACGRADQEMFETKRRQKATEERPGLRLVRENGKPVDNARYG